MWKLLGINKGTFYRYCRMVHAYLSAAAFLILMFFAASGFLLNHPGWLGAERKADEPVVIQLNEDLLLAAMGEEDAASSIVSMISETTRIRGALKSSEVSDYDVSLRYAGVKGATDIFVDLETGVAEVETSRANITSIIHNLHRGKDAGVFWKTAIDVAAILILTMSIAGLILFFSLRFRLATSLKIMAGTLVTFIALFVFLTP